jgi:hypothetical protein
MGSPSFSTKRRIHSVRAKFGATLCGVGVLMLSAAMPVVAEPVDLSVQIVDQDSQPLPCRAWVDAGGQRYFEPVRPSSCTPYSRDRSFSCNGRFEISVPAGRAVVHLERGKEYAPVDQTIELVSGQASELTITLRRWIDMPAEGWFSSDMHVHLGVDKPPVLRQLALADDVHVTPVFTYWLRGTESAWNGSWPEWTGEGEEVIDSHHLTTRSNIEIERIDRNSMPGGTVGASFLYNLRRPVTADRFGEHFPSDAELCVAARTHSPDLIIDTDKPSWAETVVGAALGAYDTVQVCHNHYHRANTLPGSHGMIGPLAPDESNGAEDDGFFFRTNNLYYRFLNCGFRLGVSGGSAIGVMAVPMGYNRVYAQIQGELTASKYWRAIKSGRSFATSGPLLIMTVDEQPMGSTIRRRGNSAAALNVRLHLRANEPLESLELVHDGQVIERRDLRDEETGAPINITADWQVISRRSGWLAGRALFRAADGRLRQAHCSPIYVLVDDKPIARKQDAEYMIRWIDQLVEIAKQPGRFPRDADRDQVISVFDQATSVYKTIATNAE